MRKALLEGILTKIELIIEIFGKIEKTGMKKELESSLA